MEHDLSPQEKLSIRLSFLLRHAALKEFHNVYRLGFVSLEELTTHIQSKLGGANTTKEDIKHIIKTSLSAAAQNSPRFELIVVNEIEYVRAKYHITFSLAGLPSIPGEVITIPSLAQLSTKVVCQNIKRFDLQGFPDNLVLQQILNELKKDGKLTGAALKTILVVGLESIDFTGIYVTEGNLKTLGNTCIYLKQLSLASCSYIVTQNTIEFLTARLKQLTTLDLSDCTQLSDSSLATIAKNCLALETLIIRGWKDLTTKGLDILLDYISGKRKPSSSKSSYKASNKKNKGQEDSTMMVIDDFTSSYSSSSSTPWKCKLTLLDIRQCPRISCFQALEYRKQIQSFAPQLTLLHEIYENNICFRNYHDVHFGFFSNFYPAELNLDGKVWPSVAHYFQAQKFHNTPLEETIRTTPTAEQAFDIGTSRHSEHPLRADWEAVKVGIQYKAVRAKVDQHEDFKRLLLATGTSNLIHATPSESFWGRPTYILEPYKRLDDKTKGELPTTNVVGCMYMDIRDELLNGGIPADQIYLKNTSVK